MTDVQTTTGAELREDEAGRPRTAPTRRIVLLGAGAVGATAALAACGTGTTGTNTSGSDFTDKPAPAGSENAKAGGGPAGTGTTLAATSDVPAGGGVIKGDYVITQPTSGNFKAFSKLCTHKGCDVSKVEGDSIVCVCHNSKFSIETGEPTGGPATAALAETKVKVDGDNIVAV